MPALAWSPGYGDWMEDGSCQQLHMPYNRCDFELDINRVIRPTRRVIRFPAGQRKLAIEASV